MKIRGNKGNISLLLLVNNGGNNINAIDLLWNPFQNLFYDIRMKFPVDGVRADIVFSVWLGNYERTLVQPIYPFALVYGILAADAESSDGRIVGNDTYAFYADIAAEITGFDVNYVALSDAVDVVVQIGGVCPIPADACNSRMQEIFAYVDSSEIGSNAINSNFFHDFLLLVGNKSDLLISPLGCCRCSLICNFN